MRRKQRIFYIGLFACLAINCAGPQKVCAQKKTPPNFVLFITDDIGWGDVGCDGNTVVRTPNIDRLAEHGMRFRNAYLITSSCSPSRSSIITGRYPHNTGAAELYDTLPAGQVMFPLLLRQAGYYTVLSGKNDMGRQVRKAFSLFSRGKGKGGEANWVRILRQRPKDKPFFCWFASHDAHRRWRYDSLGFRYKPDSIKVPPMLYDGPVTRKDLAGYYNQISRADYYLGELVRELKREGVLENTYIIFMSDNGRPFPRCKTYLYDSGIKTPFIVYGPDVKSGTVSSSLISSIDIAPTILALSKVAKSPSIQGQNFRSVLTDPRNTVRDFVFAEHNWHVYNAHERMVRYGDWVYIRNWFPDRRNLCGESTRVFPAGEELWDAHDRHLTTPEQENIFQLPRPTEELYQVKDDPYQFSNVADVKANGHILAYLRGILDQWIDETGDSKPAHPRADREDEYGHILSQAWRTTGEEPGASRNATKINNPGPVTANPQFHNR